MKELVAVVKTAKERKKVNFTSEQKSHINQATLASIIPGGGQFVNKQVLKGVIFLVIFALYILHLFSFGFDAFNGLITLGVTPREDHSLFLLIEGVLELLITVIFFIFYAVQMWDARNVAKLNAINPDKVNRSAKDILNNLYESGFPYLLTIPAYILMLFAIVFPVVVTILIVFTNYDFQHIPPAKLIEWTGFETFNSIFTLTTYRETFGAVFSWTVIWTLFATTLQVGLGIFLAILMNQPFIKFRRFFGVILLLPWAVPAFISILTFSNMFNPSAGAINSHVIPFINNFIPFLEIPALAWKTDPFWTKEIGRAHVWTPVT